MSFGQLGAGFARLGLGATGSGGGGGSTAIGNTAIRAPTSRDDITRGNTVGRLWLNTTTNTFYSCTDNSSGAAVWSNLGAVSALPVQASGVSWTAVYGVKSLTNTWLSGNLFDVYCAVDASTHTIVAIAGQLDIATLTTVLGGDSGLITKWYDQSGNGDDATTVSGHQPTVRIYNGRVSVSGANVVEQGGNGTGGNFNLPSMTLDMGAMTLVSVLRPFLSVPIPNTSANNSTQNLYGIYNGSSAGTVFGQALSAQAPYGEWQIVELSFFTQYGASFVAETDFSVTGFVGSASDQVQFQNEQTSAVGAPNFGGSVTAAANIGGGNNGIANWGLNDEVFAFMLAGANALSPSAMLAVRKSFYVAFGIAPQYINDNVAFVGDSLTAGYQASSQGQQGWSAATQIQEGLLNRPVRVTNWGVSQADIAYLVSKYNLVQGSVVSGAKTNTLRIAVGTNNVSGSGTGASTWASLSSYITTAQADFNHIIVDTLITNGTFDSTPAAEAERQIYNGLIRSNAAGMGYVVSDVGGNSTVLGAPGASLNATYFVGDQVHLTAAGQLVVAQYDAAALNGILGA